MYKVHVVPHTHWDREWYFTTSRSKVYLEYDFKNVLDKLESSEEFTFLLDGQTSLLDDYLELRPQDSDRIKKFVKEGRLFIGPWYTQTDQILISDESIVRNLYYGTKLALKFGGVMKIGYVPDSFGQGGNMPQIYKDAGINSCLFWRGVSDDEVKNTEFIWQGDDGTKIKAFQIPKGYYIGGNIPENKDDLKAFLEEFKRNIGNRASSKNLYFPNGFDQAPVRTNIENLIKLMNEVDDSDYVLSTIEKYIAEASKDANFTDIVTGELVTGKLMRIHKSIYSSRSDLKILNTSIQNLIVNQLEPLLAISKFIGNEYPKNTVEKIWKLMFENAAHDSIGSCVSDNTNKDVLFRYKQARELTDSLMELNARLIASRCTDEQTQILQLYNFLPSNRTDIVYADIYLGDNFRKLLYNDKIIDYVIISEYDQSDYVNAQTINLNPSREIKQFNNIKKSKIAFNVDDLNEMGYENISIVEGDSSVKLNGGKYLENEYLKVTFNDNGSFNVYDKINSKLYEEQGVIVDNGDDGDSFNYSPPREDYFLNCCKNAEVKVSNSSVVDIAEIKYSLTLPYDLNERAKKKTSIKQDITVFVKLGKKVDYIDIEISIDNKVLSHRMCMLFDSGFISKTNFSDAIFGSNERKNIDHSKTKLWEENSEDWQEKPISINALSSYVAMNDGDKSVAVFPKGVREYEIIDDNKISITLFRTYSHMGKENLLYRPGRASGEKIIETPDAQLIGEINTSISVAYGKNIDEIIYLSKKVNSPIYTYQYAEFLNGRLIFSQEYAEPNGSDNIELFSFTENRLKLSAFKPAENYDGYVFRIVNAGLVKSRDNINLEKFGNYKLFKSNILEEKLEEISFDRYYTLTLEPNKFVTLLLIKDKNNKL